MRARGPTFLLGAEQYQSPEDSPSRDARAQFRRITPGHIFEREAYFADG